MHFTSTLALLVAVPLVVSQPSGQACNLYALPTLCASMNIAPDASPQQICMQPCVKAMLSCASSPFLSTVLGGAGKEIGQMTKLCSGAGGKPGDGQCSLLDVAAYSKQEDARRLAGKTGPPDCKSKLTQEMFDCVNNPIIKSKDRANILQFKAMCSTQSAGSSAGDGKCNIMDIAAYSREDDAWKKAHPNQKQDPAQMCKSKLVQELMDCIDNPLLAKQAADLRKLKLLCTAGASGTGKAGDGVCNMMDLMKLGSDKDKNPNSQTSCDDKLMLEAFDCINNPVLADSRSEVLKYQRMCQKPNSKYCVPMIGKIGVWFNKGGICCPPGGRCNYVKEVDGPPQTCTKACAKSFIPFVTKCGDLLIQLMHDDKVADNVHQKQVREFTTKCQKMSGGH